MPKSPLTTPSWQAAVRRHTIFYLVVAALLANCAPLQAAPAEATACAPFDTPTHTLISTPVPPESRLSAVKIIDDPGLVDFGWLPGGSQAYYAISGSAPRWRWYQFDLGSQTVTEIRDPFPTEAILPLLSENGTVEVTSVSVSPDGKRALYTRAAEEPVSLTPTPAVQYDSFPLADLWLADDWGQKRSLLWARFASGCGQLSRESIWRLDGALVVGMCNPYNGMPGRFIVYPEQSAIYKLIFETRSDSKQIEAYQANISYDGKYLVFIDQEDSLWLLLISEVGIAKSSGLDEKYRVLSKGSISGSIYSPEWSLDGRVYYWRRSISDGQPPITSWRLERLDPESRKIEIVITADEFRVLMGTDLLEEFNGYLLPGFENGWSLLPEGNKALISFGSYSQVFNTGSLWLISW